MTTFYRTLVLRHLVAKKRRTLVTILGIVLGVTLAVAVSLTSRALSSRQESLVQGMAGRADLQVVGHGQGFPEKVLAEVESVPGVKTAVSAVVNDSLIILGNRKARGTFYGIEPAKESLVRTYRLVDGRLVSGNGEIALTQDLAATLALKVGARVKLVSTGGFTDFAVVGIFDSRGTVRGSLGPFGIMPLADAQRTFSREGMLSVIDILVTERSSRQAVEQGIAAKLGGLAQVGPPLERTADLQSFLDGFTFTMAIAGWISIFAGAFIIYTNVALGVAERRHELSILRALGTRRREVIALVLIEVGIVGVIGAVVGLFLGYGVSTAMVQQLTSQVLTIAGFETARPSPTPVDIGLAFAIGLGVSLLAAYQPAQETLKIDPVEAMRPGDITINGRAGIPVLRLLVGLALVAGPLVFIAASWRNDGAPTRATLQLWSILIVLVLLGAAFLLHTVLPWLNQHLLRPVLTRLFGITGQLASGNLVRQPRRTAATVTVILVSLAYMVGMGGFANSQVAAFQNWYDRTVGWDLMVGTSLISPVGPLVELEPSLAREIEQVPGVRLISPYKFSQTLLGDGPPAALLAFDFKLLRQHAALILKQGDWSEAADAMQQGGGTMISTATARYFGLKLGDTLKLPTPSGEQVFRIVGVMRDPAITPTGAVYLSLQDYVRYWQDTTISNIAVGVTDKAKVEEVRQAILAQWGGSHNLVVTSNREFWAESSRAMNGYVQLIQGLTWIAVAVSGLALANTLLSNILERRREFGTLRAVGARRGDVMRVVVVEAMSTGFMGGVLGVSVGLGLYVLFVNSSELINGLFSDTSVPWAAIGTAIVIAVVLVPLVALFPARWAARMDVVETLRYE